MCIKIHLKTGGVLCRPLCWNIFRSSEREFVHIYYWPSFPIAVPVSVLKKKKKQLDLSNIRKKTSSYQRPTVCKTLSFGLSDFNSNYFFWEFKLYEVAE